jgi:hypothetical protein
MIELLLVALILSLWWLLCPARDWYLVEWRSCSDEKLCSTSFPSPASYGFSMSVSNLVVSSTGKDSAMLTHKDGGTISINQVVFQSIDAATQYFERIKALLEFNNAYQKIYLWRTAARWRSKAFVLPPRNYKDVDGVVLMSFPTNLWVKGHG